MNNQKSITNCTCKVYVPAVLFSRFESNHLNPSLSHHADCFVHPQHVNLPISILLYSTNYFKKNQNEIDTGIYEWE